MRLRILSDLHLEFAGWRAPEVEADVVVLAGDIDQWRTVLDSIRGLFPKTPIVFVLGNHEFYRHSFPELIGKFQAAASKTNVHVLENSSVEIGGYRFLGCTLWTDFRIKGDQHMGMKNAERVMTDFRVIANQREGRMILPEDLLAAHEESRAWLEREIPRGDRARTIIVTHHAPSGRAEPQEHRDSPLAPAFASDLDALVESSGVPLWIYGHTHHNADFKIGSTRVISNQRGYPHEEPEDFRGDLVIEL